MMHIQTDSVLRTHRQQLLTEFSLGQEGTVVRAGLGRNYAVRTDEVLTAFQTAANLLTELVNLVARLAYLNFCAVALAIVSATNKENFRKQLDKR